MLGQRLRRWPNIKTSLFQRVVFAGIRQSNRPRDQRSNVKWVYHDIKSFNSFKFCQW